MPKLRGLSFETAIIERYRRRESSVEEALIEMYLAGVSVQRVEDITEALWGSKVSPSTISELNKKAYVHIEDWRNRPLQGGRYPYVYVDGIYLRRNWGGEFENVAILAAIAVNEDGYREVLGAAEGMKEDKASWVNFFQWLRSRGLDGVKLIVGDKCLGILEAVGEVFPEAKYQRCTVHFYRNVFSVTPRSKVKLVAKMLKAIHAQESKKAAREKAKAVVEELRSMKLKEAARKVEDGIEETLTYCDFPCEHWTRIRTNNVIERLNREIRRRTRVVGSFPDGNSALMLICARLRHVAGTQWGNKKYMNMKHLEAPLRTPPFLADFIHAKPCKPFCKKLLTLPTCFHSAEKKHSSKTPWQEQVLFRVIPPGSFFLKIEGVGSRNEFTDVSLPLDKTSFRPPLQGDSLYSYVKQFRI